MAAIEPVRNNGSFSWGDLVVVVESPSPMLPSGSLGSICGIRESADGTLYLVEFGNGSSLELPGKMLRHG